MWLALHARTPVQAVAIEMRPTTQFKGTSDLKHASVSSPVFTNFPLYSNIYFCPQRALLCSIFVNINET
jgi:hypothetical protein